MTMYIEVFTRWTNPARPNVICDYDGQRVPDKEHVDAAAREEKKRAEEKLSSQKAFGYTQFKVMMRVCVEEEVKV